MPSVSPWTILLSLPILLRLLKTRPLPSRETIIRPSEERVVLLGASSGIGRDLALVYAGRGARICLVARRRDALESVKKECLALGAAEDRVLVIVGDLTSTEDVIRIREEVVKAWKGLDTLHILAGVPSTSTLLDIAGVPLSSSSTSSHGKRAFQSDGPTKEGLDRLAEDARVSVEVNYIGTTLALAAFLPTLASSSRSPAMHHLSSVGAMIPAPRRAVYASTKAAALMLVETCRVECEGSGVRFLSILPGTIDNDFRTKSAVSGSKGNCEVQQGIKHDWEKLLLDPKKVVETILYHLSLNPSPFPLIPIWPLSLVPSLRVPPKPLVFLPWQYRMAFVLMRDTVLGWLYLEPSARRKYGLPA
ncbi:hypothetical protein BD324DRAFT_618829 [Kockovaella imperatae]|uniref:NAD(P)-binding protein n=1 Tax=Kockovaella imperatae TaxID=4999 RepID=A0A1Y1UMC8_9TREE|nr:hypothetical protein BD324DRAFT_618829 [Kockovaella imperatae]ORX39200.1 hypothetical protein BD324DRAFT_618829 [Kockovaella imperatae]